MLQGSHLHSVRKCTGNLHSFAISSPRDNIALTLMHEHGIVVVVVVKSCFTLNMSVGNYKDHM